MIKLSSEEIVFMIKVLPLSNSIKKELTKLIPLEVKLISDDLADELRDLCTERLDTHGFDIDYNPTEEGLALEKLIDKLYVG